MTGEGTPVRDAALEALRLGRSVLPVNENGEYAKKPHYVLTTTGHSTEREGKFYPSWKSLQTQPATPEQVETWFRNSRGKGVAVITGAISGLIILDFDGEEGKKLIQQLNLRPHVRTGSGGFHVYLRHPGHHVPTLNSKAKREMGARWTGLDIRADGGYAIMPPSRNASGPYTALRDLSDLDEVNALPPELQEFLQLVPAKRSAAPQVHAGPVRPGGVYRQVERGRVPSEVLIDRALNQTAQDGRNNAGMWLATQLRDNGYSRNEALEGMQDYTQRVSGHNTKGKAEPYTLTDAMATLDSAYSAPPREPWTLRLHDQDVLSPACEPPSPALPDEGDVYAGPHNMWPDLVAALRLNEGPAATTCSYEGLTAEYLQRLRQEQRTVYAIRPSSVQQQILNRAGVAWETINVSESDTPKALLHNLQAQVDAAAERHVQGDRSYLLNAFPEILNRRANQDQVIYPTGFSALDSALNGGFSPGLHVLGGVTAGGKTALALHIAEINARAGRPVLFITYEQSRAELWTRILSPALGISIATFRAGGDVGVPLGARLQADSRYQEIADTVAPHLRIHEGDAADRSQQWGIDRIGAEISRLKSFYGQSPMVILDYLQRMPPEADADKRHQIDGLVMALQVRLGRQLETPILLLSSVSRGNYGELLTRPLDERLGVFKESGGIEYTAYSATLLYPLAGQNAAELGCECPPAAGSPTAAMKGLWRYIVADLVKNREGEAGIQLLLKWWPARGCY